jgi:hypothetical protein
VSERCEALIRIQDWDIQYTAHETSVGLPIADHLENQITWIDEGIAMKVVRQSFYIVSR